MMKTTKRYIENPHVISSTPHKDLLPESQKRKLLESRNQFLQLVDEHTSAIKKPDVYVGMGGIAFMFFHLYEKSLLAEKEIFFDKSLRYTREALDLAKQSERKDVGFLAGGSGPYALGAVLFSLNGNEDDCFECYSKLKEFVHTAESNSYDINELLYGRAGLLFSLLFVQKYSASDCPVWLNTAIKNISIMIVKQGRKNATDEFPLFWDFKGKSYVGIAHGFAGILYMLLQCEDLITDLTMQNYLYRTIYSLTKQKTKENSYPTVVGGSSDYLIQWCHGPPGMILLFCKAYQVFKDEIFLSTAEILQNTVWEKGLLKKGLSLCHGIGGNGYSFLKLFDITKNAKYLEKALFFCEFSWSYAGQQLIHQPDHPYSLMEGIAGTVCFFQDCALIDQLPSKFPCLDV